MRDSSLRSLEQEDKERRTDHGRDHPHGHFSLGGEEPGQEIAPYQIGAAAEDAGGHQHAMVRPETEAAADGA